jgi:hypothetical protein
MPAGGERPPHLCGRARLHRSFCLRRYAFRDNRVDTPIQAKIYWTVFQPSRCNRFEVAG